MKATKSQVIKIKIAQRQLGIDEDTKLEQYKYYGVTSCTQLEYHEAETLIKTYENAGFKPTPAKGKRKYADLDKRGKPFAASSKLRMIEAIWREASNSKTDEALQTFIKNRTGVDHITFLHDEHARIIITALNAMKFRKQAG